MSVVPGWYEKAHTRRRPSSREMPLVAMFNADYCSAAAAVSGSGGACKYGTMAAGKRSIGNTRMVDDVRALVRVGGYGTPGGD